MVHAIWVFCVACWMDRSYYFKMSYRIVKDGKVVWGHPFIETAEKEYEHLIKKHKKSKIKLEFISPISKWTVKANF